MKSDEQVTVRIPRQTLAECAAAHRAELEQRGLVRERREPGRPGNPQPTEAA